MDIGYRGGMKYSDSCFTSVNIVISSGALYNGKFEDRCYCCTLFMLVYFMALL